MKQVDQTLELYLVQKAPHLPERWQEVLVKYLPWITLVLFILALPAVLALFGLSLFLAPVSLLGGAGYSLQYMLAIGVLVVSLVIEAIAIPGLFKRSLSAWKLLYYSALINAVYNLLTFNLAGLIIGTLISLYLLFQIRHHYK